MDHQQMFKSRSRVNASAQKKQTRVRQAQIRTNRRQDNLLANRNISVSPSGTPHASTSREPPAKRTFPTETQAKMLRLQQLRDQKEKKVKKQRSPFISVVPTGRIVPAKHDVVADKMRKFIEKNVERASAASQKSATKSSSRVKAVIAKPVLRPALSNIKSSTKKKGKLLQRKAEIPPVEVEEIEIQDAPQVKASNTGYFVFSECEGAVGGEPEPFVVPQLKKNKKPKLASPVFNNQFSFITSTASKKSAEKQRIVEEDEMDSKLEFFEGISPLEATKMEEKQEEEEAVQSPNLNETFSGNEEEKSPDLNDTFPTEENDEEKKELFQTAITGKLDTPKSATVRRSLMKNGQSVSVSLDLPVIEDEQKPDQKRKSRSGSFVKPRKSHRVSDDDHPNSSIHVKRNIVDHHFSVLNTETTRLKIATEKWRAEKNDDLPESAHGMIDAAVGQTELLLRKKFDKFRQLIDLFEADDPKIRAGDLEGYWCIVYMEVENLDRRYAELEQWKANDWMVPEKKSARKQVKEIRAKRNTAKPTAGLKTLIEQLRAKQTGVQPSDDATVVRSKRLHDTPTKRRSLNCSGCTPKSLRKSTKNVSLLPEGSDSTRKSVRKSTKKLAFANENQFTSTRKSSRKTVAASAVAITSDSDSAYPESILKNETKSARKRATKSVLFAVSNTPEDNMDIKPKKRNAKTPRPSKSVLVAVENENSPQNFTFPIDTSKVTLSRGRHSNKATSKFATEIAVNSSEEKNDSTPVFPVPESRRSKRLFSGLFS